MTHTSHRNAIQRIELCKCSYLLCAPFRGADGQVINLAPIRTYLSVSAHARVSQLLSCGGFLTCLILLICEDHNTDKEIINEQG